MICFVVCLFSACVWCFVLLIGLMMMVRVVWLLFVVFLVCGLLFVVYLLIIFVVFA